MAWTDWIAPVATGVDWWQSRKGIGDAADARQSGIKRARKDVKAWEGPYAKWGMEHMKDYDKLGEFDFKFDQSDPSYQWRVDQGQQALMREQAAGKALQGGGTLTRLQEYGQGMASQEYQAEFERDLKSYGTNVDYHKFPITTGAASARNMADNLAGLSMQQGIVSAQESISKGELNSGVLGDIAQVFAGNGDLTSSVLSSAFRQAASKGLEGNAAIDWVASKVGMAKDSVMNAVGGVLSGGAGAGATSVAMTGAGGYGTGLGAMTGGLTGEGALGITGMAEGFGGTFSAGLGTGGAGSAAGTAAAGGTAWGSTSLAAFGTSVALGGAILGGVALLNNMLGSDPEVGKMFRNLSKKGDPLQRMYSSGFNETWGSQFRNLFARDSAGRTSNQVSKAAKGVLASNLIANIQDPEALRQLQQREDLPRLVDSMMNAMGSGLQINRKYASSEGIQSTSVGMMKLFPDLADEIKAYESISRANRRTVSEQDSFGDLPMWQQLGGMAEPDYQAQQAAQQRLRNAIDEKLAQWKRQGTVAANSAI